MSGINTMNAVCAAAAVFLTGGCMTQTPIETEVSMAEKKNVQVSTTTGRLYGTIDIPATGGPYPVVLIISGSGPTDRDGNSELTKKANNSLKMTGEWLAANGVAALRYDKRGVGESKSAAGQMEKTVFEDMITDAERWIELLRGDNRFSSIGILGHSEGSLVGMCVASRKNVDFFVSVAGAGRPATDVIREQLSAQPGVMKKKAFPILDELAAGRRVEKVPKLLKNLFKPELQPYLISWNAYDPAAVLAELNVPVLIIQGERDIQTSMKDAEILSAANPHAELAIIQGMNHVLKKAPKGRLRNLLTYMKPKLPLSENFTGKLSAFLRKHRVI